jgi:hypothetical protein
MTHPHWFSQDKLIHAVSTIDGFALCRQFCVPNYQPSKAYAHMVVNCVFCLGTTEPLPQEPPTQAALDLAIRNITAIQRAMKAP